MDTLTEEEIIKIFKETVPDKPETEIDSGTSEKLINALKSDIPLYIRNHGSLENAISFYMNRKVN
jgi:hypothetical protein